MRQLKRVDAGLDRISDRIWVEATRLEKIADEIQKELDHFLDMQFDLEKVHPYHHERINVLKMQIRKDLTELKFNFHKQEQDLQEKAYALDEIKNCLEELSELFSNKA